MSVFIVGRFILFLFLVVVGVFTSNKCIAFQQSGDCLLFKLPSHPSEDLEVPMKESQRLSFMVAPNSLPPLSLRLQPISPPINTYSTAVKLLSHSV